MSALPIGYAEGLDGAPIEVSRWCPTCRQSTVPRDDGRCLFCDTPTIPAAEATNERSTTMTAVTISSCKIDSCNNASEDAAGPYGRLCLKHKEEARAARRDGGGNVSRRSSADGYVSRVRALLPSARSLDQALRKVEQAGSNEKLEAEFAEASRRASAVANDENLERLEKATKALRRGGPKRADATRGYQEAERRFKVALGAIAADFRGT